MASKVLHGARATVWINGKLIGIFTNVSWGLSYDAQPAYILGRFSPAEIDYTAQEMVSISASGWRIYDKGPHVSPEQGGAGIPRLQDLLNADYAVFEIFDRANPGRPIMKVTDVRHTGYSQSVSSRQLTEISMTFVGRNVDAENGDAASETAGATELP